MKTGAKSTKQKLMSSTKTHKNQNNCFSLCVRLCEVKKGRQSIGSWLFASFTSASFEPKGEPYMCCHSMAYHAIAIATLVRSVAPYRSNVNGRTNLLEPNRIDAMEIHTACNAMLY